MSDLSKSALFLVVFIGIVLGGVYLIGAKDTECSVSATIARSPASVFAFLTQPELRCEWTDSLKSCRLSDGSEVNSQSRYESVVAQNGRDVPVVEEVKLLETDKVVTMQRNLAGITSTRVFTLDASGNRTVVVYRYLEKRDVMAALTFFLNRHDLKSSMLSELERLQAVVEAKTPIESPAEPATR